MILFFNASESARAALDDLMGKGEFKDISEAITAAILSYHAISRAVVGNTSSRVAEIRTDEISRPKPATTKLEVSADETVSASSRVPDLFALDASTRVQRAEYPDSEKPMLSVEDITPKEWFFGQYNRLFPAKVTARGLMRLLDKSPTGVPVEEAASTISYAACGLGDLLADFDRRYLRGRDAALAAAFPTTAIHGAQSRARFGNQFVAALKQGKLIGLPASLRLIHSDDSKNPRIVLTKQGMDFAMLQNNILDAGSERTFQKFSQAEIQFLLSHITEFVPEELAAYVAIIDGIEDGASAPNELDEFLRTKFDLADEAAITAPFLSTQRSGAISRMVELNLIAREKQGLRVTYVVTHPGKCFRNQIH